MKPAQLSRQQQSSFWNTLAVLVTTNSRVAGACQAGGTPAASCTYSRLSCSTWFCCHIQATSMYSTGCADSSQGETLPEALSGKCHHLYYLCSHQLHDRLLTVISHTCRLLPAPVSPYAAALSALQQHAAGHDSDSTANSNSIAADQCRLQVLCFLHAH